MWRWSSGMLASVRRASTKRCTIGRTKMRQVLCSMWLHARRLKCLHAIEVFLVIFTMAPTYVLTSTEHRWIMIVHEVRCESEWLSTCIQSWPCG